MPKLATKKAAVKKKRPAQKTAQDIGTAAPSVKLRTPEKTFKIPKDALDEMSREWYFMVRRRSRWSDSTEARSSLADSAEEAGFLRNWEGDAQRHRWRGLVEIQIPFEGESTGWAARIMPWNTC